MDADHTFLTSENPLCTIDPYRHKNIVHCFAQLAAGLPGSSHLGAVAPGSGRATAGEIWLFRKNWARLAVYKLHCRGVVPKASFLRRPGRCENPGDPLWVCLKMGYTPNCSHLVGIMISKTIGCRGTLFSDKPLWSFWRSFEILMQKQTTLQNCQGPMTLWTF